MEQKTKQREKLQNRRKSNLKKLIQMHKHKVITKHGKIQRNDPKEKHK